MEYKQSLARRIVIAFMLMTVAVGGLFSAGIVGVVVTVGAYGLYNFGVISILPLIILLITTIQWVWQRRRDVLSKPVFLETTMAALYLLLFEKTLMVGMRQPYPGIITLFIWGLLIARLQRLTKGAEQTDPNT